MIKKKAEEINAARTKHKLVKPVALSPKPYTDRNIEVMRGYLGNETMAELATRYNVSTPRIRQIIQKMYKLFISYLKRKNEFIQLGDLDKTRITKDLTAKFNNFLDNYKKNVKEGELNKLKVEINFGKKLMDEPLAEDDTLISFAYLSARTRHILENCGYKTMNQVANLTQQEFLSLPGLGKKSLNEVQEYFETYQA